MIRRLLAAVFFASLALAPARAAINAPVVPAQAPFAIQRGGDTMSGPLAIPGIAGGSPVPSIFDQPGAPVNAPAYANGFATHPFGTYVEMCSVTSCPAGPHMFAQTYGQATTRLDGTAQEIGAFFNFTDKTGYAPNWHVAYSFTSYANNASLAGGAIVNSGGILFTTRAACTTASSGSGPSSWLTPGYGAVEPTATNVPDGTCIFDYTGPAYYQAYTGVGSSTASNTTAVSANNGVYTNSVANCTPASSGGGPSGTGSNIPDGTCRWTYLSLGVNDGKSGFSIASVAMPGGGDFWGFDSTMAILPGYGGQTWYGFETDFNNLNQDSSAGSPMFALGHFDGGGSAYTYPIFAYYFLGSGAVNSTDNLGNPSRNPYGAHYGFFIAGQPGDVGSVAKDAGFADSSNSTYAFQSFSGRAHAAAFDDDSNSNDVLRAVGTHAGYGLDFSGASFQFGNWGSVPDGTYLLWSGTKNFMGHNSSSGCLTYGATNSGTNYNFASCDDGSFKISGSLTLGGAVSGAYLQASGPIGGVNVYDRITSQAGDAIFYRSNGVNRLADSNGNDVITYTNTAIGLTQAVTLGGTLLAPSLATAAASGASVKGTVCADSNGTIYVKTTSGACL